VFAAVSKARAHDIARTIERQASRLKFIVPSHDPADPRFEAKRYWRGPAWLVMNYMIADGLRAIGETDVAAHIARASLDLIMQSGFAEYYDPVTGEPCGGGRFTWTAAMVVEFLAGQQ
jgi:glycogen debranching enzyme